MKKFLHLIALLFIVLGAANSQHVVAITYVEKTHVSPKTGIAIVYEFREGIQLGGFYQKHAGGLMSREENMPRFYEKRLGGVYFSYPINNYGPLNLYFNIRTGVSNDENFMITPSLLASYEPIKSLIFGLGMGVRTYRPTLEASAQIRLK